MAARITVAELEAILAIQDRMTPVLPKIEAAVDKVDLAVRKLPPALDQFTAAQQRAAMKMERLHEEALKMNTGFKASDDRAQLFSQTLSRVSTTATASAAALGLPIGPLKNLDSAIDVAGIGFNNLAKSSVGFNAASVAVVGGGLAVGAMIGGLIRQLPGAAEAYDALAASALNYFGLIEKNTGPATTNVAAMGAIAQQVQQNVINLMRSQGKTTDEIIAQLQGKVKTATNVVVDSLKKNDAAIDRNAAAVKKAKEALEQWQLANEKAATAAYEEWVKRQAKAMEDLAEETRKAKQFVVDFLLLVAASTKTADEGLAAYLKRQEEMASNIGKKLLDDLKAAEKAAADLEEAFLDDMRQLDALGQAIGNLGEAIGSDLVAGIGDAISVFAQFGAAAVKAKTDTEKAAVVFQAAATAYEGGVMKGVAAGAQAGSMFGPWGAAIGAVAGGILGFIGKAKRLREEMEKMRSQFIQSVGGLEALRLKADTAGISLGRLFDAKNAQQLSAEIERIQKQLGLWDEAQEKLNAAVEKYGFTIEELGPKFAQQKLDEMAIQLLQDYRLLTAAGVDHNAIIERMGPHFNEYVNTAIRAGSTIPAALRPIIEQMIAQGKLLDENGDAYESVEAAGISFATSTSDALKLLIDKITDLVNALLGIPNISRTVTINTKYTSGGNGNEPPVPGETPEEAAERRARNRERRREERGAASGFFSPALPYDMSFRAHQGERVEITPASQSSSTPSGDIHVAVYLGADKLVPTMVRLKKAGYL